MLKTLRISNYALINKAEIHFDSAMNIITGETGAGKSILLGALNLITGARADAKVLFAKEKKCIVEAVFDLRNYELQAFFKQAEIDYENETIIRRELSENGKSRAFVNDSPVNLSVLQSLSDKLITIHSQHETLALSDSSFQLLVIDSLAGNANQLSEFKNFYKQWKKISEDIIEQEVYFAKALIEKDFIEFQLKELESFAIETINQEALESELIQLNHAEEIKTHLFAVLQLLENGQINVLDQLRAASNNLQSAGKYDVGINEYLERISSAALDLKDITFELSKKAEFISADPPRAEEINQILSHIFRLQKKHQVNDLQALLHLKTEMRQTLTNFEQSDEIIQALKEEQKKLFHKIKEHAILLSERRNKQFSSLEKKVKQILADAGMPDAIFSVKSEFDLEKNLNETGADTIHFLFSANKGSSALDIKKVASGGELSRLMLAIKSLLAASASLPTLIFDEIDTGVSGAIAGKVGNILMRLAQHHQVLVITHLPQIAGKGRHHLFVYKTSDSQSTITQFKLLNKKDRLQEIAKMLSGENPSNAALKTAAELLETELQ